MKKKSIIITGIISVFWIVYALFFFQIASEFKDIYTSGANLDIQIIEILNYEAMTILILIVLYFLLLGSTFLYSVYSYLIKYKNKNTFIISLTIPVLVSLYTFTSKIGVLLIVIALITIGVIFTIYTLTKNEDYNEDGDIIYVYQDVPSLEKSQSIADDYITSHEQDFIPKGFALDYDVILTSPDKYEVSIYIKKTANSGGNL